MRVHVTDNGVADKVEVARSSGHDALDQAAVKLIKRAEWGNEGPGRKTDYWTTTSITFDPNTGPMLERRLNPAMKPTDEQLRGAIRMKRELLNGEEVARALIRAYPPLLRDAGIGGEVMLWVLVDATGNVTQAKVGSSSGRAELDAAAVEVAVGKMKFAPAKNGQNVKTWIALPVSFKTQ